MTQCVYWPESKALKCRGQTGKVECDAVGNFSALGSKMFHVFGIGKLQVESVDAKPESIKYFLYPRTLENQTYFNYSVPVDENLVDLMLYSSEWFTEYGIRIPVVECFKKLVDLLRSSTEDHIVNVSSDLAVKSEVSLIGEILSHDKVGQKRHYGGGWDFDNDWDFDWD